MPCDGPSDNLSCRFVVLFQSGQMEGGKLCAGVSWEYSRAVDLLYNRLLSETGTECVRHIEGVLRDFRPNPVIHHRCRSGSGLRSATSLAVDTTACSNPAKVHPSVRWDSVRNVPYESDLHLWSLI